MLKQARFAAAFWSHQQHRQAAAQPGHNAKHHIPDSLCHHQLGVSTMQITKGTQTFNIPASKEQGSWELTDTGAQVIDGVLNNLA